MAIFFRVTINRRPTSEEKKETPLLDLLFILSIFSTFLTHLSYTLANIFLGLGLILNLCFENTIYNNQSI